jgi:uncharacterized membrane protein YkvA (DUF1232 family)
MSVVWIAVLGGLVLVCGALVAAALLAWRRGGPGERDLVRRILRLSLRRKLRLALALVRDPRIPLVVRAIPPALILYLATPIDLIPDFIPVLGHLDDAAVLILGVGLLLRFTPRDVLEEHVSRLEAGEAGV